MKPPTNYVRPGMKRITLELPDEMYATIEASRRTPQGEIARNEWIRDAIAAKIAKEQQR